MKPKYPDVKVQLSGQEDNVFAIIGRISAALEKAGYDDAAAEFANRSMSASSYDEVLQIAIQTVTVS